jgi:hypothetical protein
MIHCDLCGRSKACLPRQIEDKEYDICSACWNPLAKKLKGKGRVRKELDRKDREGDEREMVILPQPFTTTPVITLPEPRKEPQAPPGGPPKIWSGAGPAI